MAIEVLHPQNILLPQRIQTHRKPHRNSNTTSRPLRKSPPPPPASRKAREGSPKPANTAVVKKTAAGMNMTEIYAGPGFSMSPDPSLLPLPQFPVKRDVSVAPVDDAATLGLMRMLRLA